MSHAPRDRMRSRYVATVALALLPSLSAWAQVSTVNPTFWATPDRFQGLSYQPISQVSAATRYGGQVRPTGHAHPLHPRGQQRSAVRYTLLSDQRRVQQTSAMESETGFSVVPPEGAVLEPMPTPAGGESSPIWTEPHGACASCGDAVAAYGGSLETFDTCASCAGYDSCGNVCGDGCGGCNGCWGPAAPFLTLRYTTFSFGVSGFKNASNLSADGSFGFHEGVNYASPIPLAPETGWGWQVGFRSVQSDLSGASFTTSQRNQTFFTAGAFRRTTMGLQGGIVFDLLRDAWYDHVDLSQVRGEISWKCPARHEWGYWFAAGDRRDTTISPITANQVETWEPTNIHAFFYRRRFACLTAAEGRLYAGFSDNRDGLLGADAAIPVNDRWLLRSSFTYLIPDEATNAGGTQNEGWNLALAGVWHFGRNAQVQPSRYTPLFDVADNGTFFVDRVSP